MWNALASSNQSSEGRSGDWASNGDYYQPLYNEGFYNEIKAKYSNALMILGDPSSSLIEFDSALRSLQEISESIQKLLPDQRFTASEDASIIASQSDSYTVKWKKLLFLSQKNYLQCKMKLINPKQSSSVTLTKAELESLYLSAIETFELMLDLNESDLVMMQVIFFFSLQCEDYWTFEHLLNTYSGEFNRFYANYLKEQWQLLAKLPRCSPISIGTIFPSDLSSADAVPQVCSFDEALPVFEAITNYIAKFYSNNLSGLSCSGLAESLCLTFSDQSRAKEVNTSDLTVNGVATASNGNCNEGGIDCQEKAASLEKTERRLTRNLFHTTSMNTMPGESSESGGSSSVEYELIRIETVLNRLAESYPDIANYSSEEFLKESLLPIEEEEEGEDVPEDEEPEKIEDNKKEDIVLVDAFIDEKPTLLSELKGYDLFLSTVNKLTGLLNDALSSSNRAHYDFTRKPQMILQFLIAASEFVSLIFENKSFYSYYFHEAQKQHWSGEEALKKRRETFLKFFQSFAFSEMIITLTSELIVEQVTTSEQLVHAVQHNKNAISLLMESSIHVLLRKQSIPGDTDNSSSSLLMEKAEEILSGILLSMQLNHSDLLTSFQTNNEMKPCSFQELRRLWDSIFYFQLIFHYLPLNPDGNKAAASNTPTSKQKGKTKKRRTFEDLHPFFREYQSPGQYDEFIGKITKQNQYTNELFTKLQDNLASSNTITSPTLLCFLPHLADSHFHLLSQQLFQANSTKLSDFLTSQRDLFIKLTEPPATINSFDGAGGKGISLMNSSLLMSEEIDKLFSTYCTDAMRRRRKRDERPESLVFTKTLLSHLEIGDSFAEMKIVQLFQGTSKGIRKSLKKKEEDVETNALEKRWKDLVYLQFVAIEEFLYSFQQSKAPVKSPTDNGATVPSSFTMELLCEESFLYSFLGSFLAGLTTSIDQINKLTTARSLRWESSEIQDYFSLIQLALSHVLTILSVYQKKIVTIDQQLMKFLLSFAKQLKRFSCVLLTSFEKPNVPSSLIETSQTGLTRLTNYCLFWWFSSAIGDGEVSVSPSYEMTFVLSLFFRWILCERNFQQNEPENEDDRNLDCFPYENIELSLAFCLSVLQTTRSCPPSFSQQKELIVNGSSLLCQIFSANKAIRNHLDSQKIPFINRFEFYQFSVNYFMQHLSVLFPSLSSSPDDCMGAGARKLTDAVKTKRKRLKGMSSDDTVPPMETQQSDRLQYFLSYQRLLAPIMKPFVYSTSPNPVPSSSAQLSAVQRIFTLPMQRLCCAALGKIYAFLYSFPFPLIFEKKLTDDDGQDDHGSGDENVSDAEEVSTQLIEEVTNPLVTSESVLNLYYFANYCIDVLQILTKNDIRDIYFWIITMDRIFSKEDDVTTKKDELLFSNYLFSPTSHLLVAEEDWQASNDQSEYYQSFFSVYCRQAEHCIDQLLTKQRTENGKYSKFSPVNMKENIFLYLFDYGIPMTVEDSMIRAFISWDYYEQYELRTFQDLVTEYPFLRIIQNPLKLFADDLEDRDDRGRKKRKSSKSKSSKSVNNNNNTSNKRSATARPSSSSTSMDENLAEASEVTEDEETEGEQESSNILNEIETAPVEYSLFLGEKYFLELFVLQRDLSSFPFLTSSSTSSIDVFSLQEDISSPLLHVFQCLAFIREKLNNIMHERCLYDQTKEFFQQKRADFFALNNHANSKKFDFFRRISTDLRRSNGPSSSIPSNTSGFDHVKNTCCFWPFHSYFLVNLFVPYVEEFYSFLEKEHFTSSSSSRLSSSSSMSLESWFAQSRAKDVYLQQLIPKKPQSSADVCSALIALPDNIQFIKSILLLDYFIVVLEEFLFQFVAILFTLHQQTNLSKTQTLALSSPPSPDNIEEGDELMDIEEIAPEETQIAVIEQHTNQKANTSMMDESIDSEESREKVFFLEEFSLLLINSLNNIPKGTASSNNNSKRTGLKEFLQSFLIAGNYQNRSLFALTMTPRLSYQIQGAISRDQLSLLQEAAQLFKEKEKDLSKKERLSFAYHFHSLCFKQLWAIFSRSQQGMTEEDELVLEQMFSNCFPIESMGVKNSNFEAILGKLSPSQHQRSQFSREEKLWLLLSLFLKNLLDVRKKDSYHFQTSYRLAVILSDLAQNRDRIPGWVIAGQAVTSSSSSLLLLGDDKVEDSLHLSQLFVSQEEGGGDTMAMAVVVGESENEMEREMDCCSSSQPPSPIKSTRSAGPPQSLRLGNPMLNSFLSDLSMKKALLEMHKLFEKRLPQILAMWHDPVPDNPWEKILAQTSEFDAWRRKITSKYLELCQSYVLSLSPADVFEPSMFRTHEALMSLMKHILEKCLGGFTSTTFFILEQVHTTILSTQAILLDRFQQKFSSSAGGQSLSVWLDGILPIYLRELDGYYRHHQLLMSKRFPLFTVSSARLSREYLRLGQALQLDLSLVLAEYQRTQLTEANATAGIPDEQLTAVNKFLSLELDGLPITATMATTAFPAPSSSSSQSAGLSGEEENEKETHRRLLALCNEIIAVLKKVQTTGSSSGQQVNGNEGQASKGKERRGKKRNLQESQQDQQALAPVVSLVSHVEEADVAPKAARIEAVPSILVMDRGSPVPPPLPGTAQDEETVMV